MVEHQPVMGNLSVLVLDDDPTSLQTISNMLVESGFKVVSFQTVETALDFIKSRTAIKEEIDLVLAEVHLRNIRPHSFANSELLHHILNELQVLLITMCAYNDEEAFLDFVALGACFHVLKPLHRGSLNVLKQKAVQHKSKKAMNMLKQKTLELKSKKAIPQGLIPRANSRMVSSSTKRTKEMLIPKNLSHPKSNDFEGPKVGKAHGCSKKLDRANWTIELHEKFLDAIEVLGDKFATPSGIQKLMKVKGLTLKHIASHLQKHRLRQQNAKQRGKYLRNANMKLVSELIGSAENAATTESITPRDDTDNMEVYPSRLWAQVKKKLVIEAVALKTCTYTCTYGIYRNDTKSVWDEYPKGLQKDFSPSNRHWQQLSVESNVMVTDGCVSSEAHKAAGEIGYGAATENSGSSSRSTSLVDQFGENNRTEAAGNNGNMGNINLLKDGGVSSEAPKAASKIGYVASIEISGSSSLSTSLVDQVGENNRIEAASNNDNIGNINLIEGFVVVEGTMNKEHTAAKYLSDVQASLMSDDLDLIGPSDGREEQFSCWKSLLEGSQDQQNLGLEDTLQVDNAWNTVVASPSLINIDGSKAQAATVQNGLVDNPVVPIAQDDGFWPWSPPVGDFDMML